MSLYIDRIELTNFGPYRGHHDVQLGEGVHAVVASRDGDLEKSNWVGKSWFLSAIPFALYGWHMAKTEDGLINDDEKRGDVVLHLSDGSWIRRNRARGSSTKLSLRLPGKQEVKDAVAEAGIVDLLGLRERDYFATSFAKQKEISNLIVGLPSERLKMIRSWLDLEAIDRREAVAWAKAADAQTSYGALTAPSQALDAHLAKLLARLGSADDAALAAKLAEERVAMKLAEAEVTKLVDERSRAENVGAVARAKEKLELVATEIRKTKEQLAALAPVSDEELAAAQKALNDARSAQAPLDAAKKAAATAARGEFSGTCPVAGIACPATIEINTSTASSRRHLELATANAGVAQATVSSAEAAQSTLGRRRSERRLLEAKLDGLEKQEADLKALAGKEVEAEVENETPVVERLRGARERLSDAARRVIELEGLEAETRRLRAALPPREKFVAGQIAITAGRAAAKIWKKVQTVIAEGAMNAVERGANASLREAGIDLSVGVTWARYGDGLASSCEECGAPFPTSAKVKVCSHCGAQRGPKMVERLDIEPSDRSGAADDLAGIGVRLSASAWLRARKNVRWSNACIDEPFGSLDVSNKRAIAAHLTNMLGGKYGFVQTFVVAHDRIVTDALPRRIHIDSKRDGSVSIRSDFWE